MSEDQCEEHFICQVCGDEMVLIWNSWICPNCEPNKVELVLNH